MINDPYSTPVSFSADRGRSPKAPVKLYTPLQVAILSAASGAFGLAFALWINYRALGKATESRLTVLAGAMVGLIQCGAALSFKTAPPGLGALIVVGLTIAGMLIAHCTQLSRKQIAESERMSFGHECHDVVRGVARRIHDIRALRDRRSAGVVHIFVFDKSMAWESNELCQQ